MGPFAGSSLCAGASLHAQTSQSALLPSASGFSIGRLQSEAGIGTSGRLYQKLCGARCSATSEKSRDRNSKERAFQSPLPVRDFYEILGVPVEATPVEIRQAYRNLQKKHHPDVVGKKGDAMTLLLNEAYQTLMDENLRAAYNRAHSYKQSMRDAGYKTFNGSPYSSWVGPDRPQGIFVDENVCVGMASAFVPTSNTDISPLSTLSLVRKLKESLDDGPKKHISQGL